MRNVLIATLLLFATAAHADQARDREAIPGPGQPVASESHDKSPELAVAMSIGTTVAGYALMSHAEGRYAVLGLGAAFFGPSVGQWYAGKSGGLGLAARGLGLGLAFYGFVHLMSTAEASCADCAPDGGRAQISEDRRYAAYLGTGAALWIGSTIYDVLMAYRETDRYNQRQHATLVPTMIPTAYGTQAPGLGFSMKF